MTDKILCPWCGAEMKNCTKILGSKSVSAMECLCGAKGPTGLGVTNREAEEAARAAAMRRYTPPITTEKKLVCPINGAPCSECKPGSPCGVEVMKDA